MKCYAGIGARNTPFNVLNTMKAVGVALAQQGYTCITGAAPGADQAFAMGAAVGVGDIVLCLPWATYEESWVRALNKSIPTKNRYGNIRFAALRTLVYNERRYPKAAESVTKYHPNPSALSPAAFSLHARNYMIVEHVQFVYCWTRCGQVEGGTGQAIRICKGLGITVYNLGDPNVYKATLDRLQEIGLYTMK